jgi:hypothetical protein
MFGYVFEEMFVFRHFGIVPGEGNSGNAGVWIPVAPGAGKHSTGHLLCIAQKRYPVAECFGASKKN